MVVTKNIDRSVYAVLAVSYVSDRKDTDVRRLNRLCGAFFGNKLGHDIKNGEIELHGL